MNTWIDRAELVGKVEHALKRSRIVALLGPRQCGKTTLARVIAGGRKAEIFDLEHPATLVRLKNPLLALEPIKGLVVIDEIHRMPELFPTLRVLADRHPLPARFLLLGSASPELLRHSSETLAGRVEFVYMTGFTLDELDVEVFKTLWLRGGFPRSYLTGTDEDSFMWRESFLQTFMERDLRNLGVGVSAMSMRRFWSMTAHYHGQIWNASEIAGSLGLSSMTARRYLDIMTYAYMIRQLPPWHANLAKRQVKAHKVYIRDTGLLHALLGLQHTRDIEGSPKYGASWEGFVIEYILNKMGERHGYFWATHGGAELDLLLMKNGKKWGFECKCADAPALTPSMRIAMTDLKLDWLYIIYPGREAYQLDKQISVVPISGIVSTLNELA